MREKTGHERTWGAGVMPHTVSIIVVNLNGRSLLGECLDALARQDYPRDRVEVIMVDNGSTDDSVAFVREAYPAVRIVQAGRNLGFAGGNNRGAQVATGDYLALINNDARADPRWLSALVEMLDRRPEVACAASKILSIDGRTIDFVGPAMNLYGRSFQIDEGRPVEAGFYDEARELLAPCGGAMMIRREVFWQVGGFDEDYLAYFEDLDLGWRLWLHGYQVMFAPQAVVFHHGHQTGAGFPVEQRYALSETNALRTIIKNYEEANLWRVLPFSLFMGVKRALDQDGVDRTVYQLNHSGRGAVPAEQGAAEPHLTRVAAAFLVAIDRVADELPRLLAKRRRIQAARVRSDAEIFSRFPIRPDNPLFAWRHYHVIQDQLAAEMGVSPALQPKHGARLLIITHETIGSRMAGPGIRAWEMACALAERFDVTLAAPGEPDRRHPGLHVVGYLADHADFPGLDLYLASADVVLAMGSLFASLPRLRNLIQPAIVDLYDPFELERLAQSPTVADEFRSQVDGESVYSLRLEGALGDFFICASERQRDLWLGTLLAAGRINSTTYQQDATLRQLIDVVPFGMPAELPVKRRAVLKGVHPAIAASDKVLLWNGGLWQWFDPLTLVEALARVVRVRSDVRLYFAAGKHFNTQTVPEMPIVAQTIERCRALGLLDRHVIFGEWIPYDERGDYLLEADLAVSTHPSNLESRFASRTRLVDCIWAGLPVITTEGDTLSELIAARGLGRAVPPGQPDALAQAILDMLADADLRRRVEANARPVRQELAWPRVVEPIVSFLNRAAFAPDAMTAARAAAQAVTTADRIRRLEQETQQLRAHIEAIQRGRVMRLLQAVQRMFGGLDRDRTR